MNGGWQVSDSEYTRARMEMVKNQIQARGIRDEKVLNAMREVPRHLFVPFRYRNEAYSDHPLPIGEGQTISQPYIVGLMTEALGLKGDERVLEIGTGSGYQAAILSRISGEVYTVEIIESLSLNAQEVISKLGYKNIKFKVGDGWKGWKEYADFDAIIVTAAASRLPKELVKQLKDGGRMVIPIGQSPFNQYLWKITKQGDEVVKESLGPVIFVPLVEGKDK
ncbi:MAG: protein-L-isoaspartate(D-aspartate) O-methyltransferase [Candidatus Eremiobacteraeota bacterium]|nr:protein-L-isoaspartate(D-aspartate) O-methyltransferase [Candidatus Eremiobacteraeota bacterium]